MQVFHQIRVGRFRLYNVAARDADGLGQKRGNGGRWARPSSSGRFLDGHHSYRAVCRDIELAESCLVEGGWICFDDAFTSYDGVDRAIEERILGNPAYEQCQQLTRKLFVARRRRGG